VEVEAVRNGATENEVTDGGTSLHFEDGGVVLLEPRPAVGKRAVPVEELRPVAKEDRIGVEVDSSETVCEDEAGHVGEDDGEAVVLVGRRSDALEQLVLVLGRQRSGDLGNVELASLVGGDFAGGGESGFGGMDDLASLSISELFTLCLGNLVVARTVVALDVVVFDGLGGLSEERETGEKMMVGWEGEGRRNIGKGEISFDRRRRVIEKSENAPRT
jgi:hypothetical protein